MSEFEIHYEFWTRHVDFELDIFFSIYEFKIDLKLT